jgi:hypothetical protein
MSNVNRETQRAAILWLSGVRLEDILSHPEVRILKERGAMVELVSSPITSPRANHFQVLSGRLPASFGFFDTLVPLCHLPRSSQGSNGYDVVEEYEGRDTTPNLLHDLLSKAGWMVEYKEILLNELAASLQDVQERPTNSAVCKIFKCTIADSVITSTAADSIAEALRVTQSWVGEEGLFAFLSDMQPAPVQQYVNVNNFLAEMGVIERDEQSGSINWPNTLAYYAGHGQLWVNLAGRDPRGAVHPQDEYEEVRDTLVKALPIKLRDEQTGCVVIERVYRKEELYSADYLFCAPDLIVLFKPGYAPSPRSSVLDFDEKTFTTPAAGATALAGVHPSDLKGFLLASGPALEPGATVTEPAPLTSVVPTLLHALNVAPVDMECPAVSGLFSPAYLETHPVRKDVADQGLSEEDEELVINRLRDLGYV